MPLLPQGREQLLGQGEELTGRCDSSFWWWLPSQTIPVSVLCALHTRGTGFGSSGEVPTAPASLRSQSSLMRPCMEKRSKPVGALGQGHIRTLVLTVMPPYLCLGLWSPSLVPSPSSLTRSYCLKWRN